MHADIEVERRINKMWEEMDEQEEVEEEECERRRRRRTEF